MARRFPLALSILCIMMLSACNPFTDHYSGDRFPSGPMPKLVESAPADTTRIGTSVFATSEDCTSAEALAAARSIGAEYVVYEKIDLGEQSSWEQSTLMTRSGAAGGTMAVNVPVPVTRRWHEYRATFYRESGESSEGQ